MIDAIKYEKSLHILNKANKYVPLHISCGKHECYNKLNSDGNK